MLREVENINIRFKKGTEDHDRKMRAALKEFVPVDFEPKDIGEVKIFSICRVPVTFSD